jgi:hypothetical protein
MIAQSYVCPRRSPEGPRFRRSSLWTLGALLAICLASALPSHAQDSSTQPSGDSDSGKVKKEFYTPGQRLDAMRAASLFSPSPVADADIMAGPKQSKKLFQLHFDDKVTCDFATPGSQMGGKTPKFECKITQVESPDGQVQKLTDQMDEEPVKVKFGADNREVYAEVVATRLLWSLGYYADAWYPVRVECRNCPDNPESGSGPKLTRSYAQATIVRKFDGHKMYEIGKDDQGWSWKEFEGDNGRPSFEKDGLKLLAAFIMHSDNKPPQQRLACKGVNVDQSTSPFTTTCRESFMLIQDVGASFGGGGWFTSNGSAKMNLSQWSGKRVWQKVGPPTGTGGDDCPVCQATLKKSLTAKDGLSNPTISEEGRQFAAGLLCQLSDAQIEALFKASRVYEMPEFHNGDGSYKSGMDESSILRQWVEAFKRKREEIAGGRCRWKDKPTDLSKIENPGGLSTVPNFCTARPF